MQPPIRPLFLLTLLAVLAATACSGKPVSFSEVCAKANDKQRIEATGYLDNTGSAMCSTGYGQPWRCPINFVETLGSKQVIRAYIDKGGGSNEIDAVGAEGLKIRDDDGKFIERATRVKITAKVKRLDDAGSDSCYVDVKKIARQ